MKISAIELFHVSIPLPEPFRPAWIPGYPQTHNRFTFIRLSTDEGLTGYSAGTALGTERAGLGNYLGEYLLGADPTKIGRIQELLKQAGFLGWHNTWIEPACWDIIGKMEGKPVYEVLGGSPRHIPVYLSTGEVRDPQSRIDSLLNGWEHGFRTGKVHVMGKRLEEDVKLIREIRKALPQEFQLGVDAGQGWKVSIVERIPPWDLERAREFASACSDLDISWLEEPLDARNYDGNAALKKISKVRISGAELCSGWDELKIMLQKDCFHIYQPDAVFAGGIQQIYQTIQACHKHGRDFSPHTWSNGIGFYINWNMALADSKNSLPLEFPLEEPSWIPRYREGIIKPVKPDRNGLLKPFQTPGLGFEIIPDLLKRYGQRYFKLNKSQKTWQVIMDKGIFAGLELIRKKIRSA